KIVIETVEGIPRAIIFKCLWFLVRNLPWAFAATGFIDVVAKKDDYIQILAHHVLICRVVAGLILLARRERKSNAMRRILRSSLCSSNRALDSSRCEPIPIPAIRLEPH